MDIEKIRSIKDIKEIFLNFLPIFYHKSGILHILSMCFYRIQCKDKDRIGEYYVKINEDYYQISFLRRSGLIRIKYKDYLYVFNIYHAQIDTRKVLSYPPQNLLKVVFQYDHGEIVLPMVYNMIYYKRYRGLTSKVYKIKGSDLVCFFRQAKLNSIALTVREANTTDLLSNRFKIFAAKVCSLLTPSKDIILMYEKESSKYEESASVLYEKLMDMGYQKCFYLIGKNSKHLAYIQDKYLKNIIYTHTFKHYYYFFKCHKFMGTETVPHALELRAANKYITRKYIKKKYQQVFLQHGVMYMVALDARTRSGFRKNGNEMPADAKIVVSSQLEADHFVQLGGFDYSDLYVTGLPFYDRTIKKENADKILIMPTWRNWDYNALLSDYENASYYQFIKRIIAHIPEAYQKKVWVLPHPLVLSKFRNTDLIDRIPQFTSYDEVLQSTALLITDYSSVAYSAFYRGANVIFCWEELEACMEHYKSHLMLNESNVFGDIAYCTDDLENMISLNYMKPQREEYRHNYQKIVEFSDRKNTERLIRCLQKDAFI